MPCYDIKCKSCGFVLQDVIFPPALGNNRIVIKCEVCGEKGKWTRLFSKANIPPSGRYSYDDKKT